MKEKLNNGPEPVALQTLHPGWLGNPATIRNLLAGKLMPIASATPENRKMAAFGSACAIADILMGMEPVQYPPTVVHTEGLLSDHLLSIYGDEAFPEAGSGQDVIRAAIIAVFSKALQAIADDDHEQLVATLDYSSRILAGLPT